MTGPDASSDEMPGFPLPGRLGRERDELALDVILDGLSPPADALPQLRGLSQLLADLAAPAGRGELTAEAKVLSGFRRCVAAAGASRVARRPVRSRSTRPLAPHHTRLAAGLVIAAAGLGGTAAAYAGVLPGPVQDFAHHAIGAPGTRHVPGHPSRVTPAAPASRQQAPQSGAPRRGGNLAQIRRGTGPAGPALPAGRRHPAQPSPHPGRPTRASQPTPRPSRPGPGNGRPSRRSALRRPDAGGPAWHGIRRMPVQTVPALGPGHGGERGPRPRSLAGADGRNPAARRRPLHIIRAWDSTSARVSRAQVQRRSQRFRQIKRR
jgi:hypothetical protein